MDIDFNKIIVEDEDFGNYCRAVTLDTMSYFNPHLIPTIWSLYNAGMNKDDAVYTMKMIIKYGGGNSESSRNNRSL